MPLGFVPRDASFTNLSVLKQGTLGQPPRSLFVNNLVVGENRSFGWVVRDGALTSLAVSGTIAGRVVGNGARFIGRV